MACGTMKNNNILELALALQKKNGWVSEENIREIASEMKLPESRVYETLSFYSMILLKKPATVRIEICRGTSCYIAGGTDLLLELQKMTGCEIGGRSQDGRYQIEYCECLGRCETAPNLIVNGVLHTSVTKEALEKILTENTKEVCC